MPIVMVKHTLPSMPRDLNENPSEKLRKMLPMRKPIEDFLQVAGDWKNRSHCSQSQLWLASKAVICRLVHVACVWTSGMGFRKS